MNKISKSTLAEVGESLAANYLVGIGYNIVARNYHSAYGEIDIVAKHNNELAIVEVKTRSSHSIKSAENSITTAKQKKITHTTLHFLASNPQYSKLSCRFDVVLVFHYKADDTYKVIHYPNAFYPVCHSSEY